jgi:DNA-binding response OmpR family regulator
VAKRILIVEDESEVRTALARRLLRCGYRVAEAENGLHALSLIHRDTPDLLILDAGLPLLDGIETLRRVREDARTAGVPVIMLTGLCDREHVHEILRLGVSQYLVKPSGTRAIEAEVLRLLGPHPAASAAPPAAGPAPPGEGASADEPGCDVLVAESNLEALDRILPSIPGRAFAARDGAEAVHAAWKLRPRVALLSTSLAVLDGIEVLVRLRALPSAHRTALVAMALRTDRRAVRLACEAGAHAILEKPLDLAAVRRLVERLLGPSEHASRPYPPGSPGETIIVRHPEIPPSPLAPTLPDRIRRIAERGIRNVVIEVDPIQPLDVSAAGEIASAIAFARELGLSTPVVARGETAELLSGFRETRGVSLHESVADAEASLVLRPSPSAPCPP